MQIRKTSKNNKSTTPSTPPSGTNPAATIKPRRKPKHAIVRLNKARKNSYIVPFEKMTERSKDGSVQYRCRCECPHHQCKKIVITTAHDLRNGRKSCSAGMQHRTKTPAHLAHLDRLHDGQRQHYDKTFGDRFWDRVDFDGPVSEKYPSGGPCWLWTGAATNAGRGTLVAPLHIPGQSVHMLAAHVAIFMSTGWLPRNGEVAAHVCQNGDIGCLRTSHLMLVPARENGFDKLMNNLSVHDRILEALTVCDLGHERDFEMAAGNDLAAYFRSEYERKSQDSLTTWLNPGPVVESIEIAPRFNVRLAGVRLQREVLRKHIARLRRQIRTIKSRLEAA